MGVGWTFLSQESSLQKEFSYLKIFKHQAGGKLSHMDTAARENKSMIFSCDLVGGIVVREMAVLTSVLDRLPLQL